ncbi:alpha/beta-hydrolase [Rhizoclosmatium globosum]|uniref:Carboxypeptidase n=1 Tax=Rhizoclosmatium globosum TaxID=329046 RepID=A0A1Y2C4N4_9FUNG|nr:alpha/beta-hydrolase [Rhizoclosmatium globosum]|eukprot:ORY41916.1 alpha/beta-hydrolase [Rhizoclosmatium globosum]
MDASSFIVRNLPNITHQLNATLNGMYAGLLPSRHDSKNPDPYFFWYVPTTSKVNTNKLVIWLNGGPGCSSLEGMWTENGPFQFTDAGALVANPFSWHKQANILYVDQPAGTGFSNVFRNTKTFDLYITGESYAGTYIPYIASDMIKSKKFNLKGIALGNPLFDSVLQYPPVSTVSDFDFFNSVGFFKGPKSAETKAQAANLAQACKNATLEQSYNLPYNCSVPDLLSDWYTQHHTTFGVGNTCYDAYNVLNEFPCDNIYDDSGYVKEQYMFTYLNDANVQKAIHIPPTQWNECNDPKLDDSQNAASRTLLDPIVASKVKVVIYDGMLDSVCQHLAVEQALGNTTWGGEVGFKVKPKEWMVSGSWKSAGKIWKNDRGLTYIRVKGAGHMVPADAPGSASAVLDELLC